MYLSDRDIRGLSEAMQIAGGNPRLPFDPELQVQPCSIDLCLSEAFWKPSRTRRLWRLIGRRRTVVDLRHSHAHDLDPLRDWKPYELGEGDTITIKPGTTVMGIIYERFRIPPGYAGKIEGRSSFARLGLMVVCQLMLIPLSSDSEHTYGDEELRSEYANDEGGPSMWWRDHNVKEIQKRLGEVHATERLQQEIVSEVRFEAVDVLERFQHFLASRKVEDVENKSRLLEEFSAVEDRRRLFDGCILSLLGILLGADIASIFVTFGAAHVVVYALSIVFLVLALRSWVRRDSGYLGKRELREAGSRPRSE